MLKTWDDKQFKILATNIDCIDDINESGSLEGIIFYQESDQNIDQKPEYSKTETKTSANYDLFFDNEDGDDHPLFVINDEITISNIPTTCEKHTYTMNENKRDSYLKNKSSKPKNILFKSTKKLVKGIVTGLTNTNPRPIKIKETDITILMLDLDQNNKNQSMTEHLDRSMIQIDQIEEIYHQNQDQGQEQEQEQEIEYDDNDDESETEFMYQSQYFVLDKQDKEFILDFVDMIKEIIVILLLHVLLGIHNAMYNVMTIDSIISCIVFYAGHLQIEEKNNFLLKVRLNTLDRYIYYALLFSGYYLLNYITWCKMTNIMWYVASLAICPSIMGLVCGINAYKKIRNVLHNGYHKLIQIIVCKQLTKIINIIINNTLNIKSVIKYNDLIPHYNKFSWSVINNFIIAFIIACIFNYFDKGGMKYLLMIYKNACLKDNNYNISNDKAYLERIITDKKWMKLMDMYTLNRMIRIMINDDSQKIALSEQVKKLLIKTGFKFDRVMLCWTITNITGCLTYGILGFLMFLHNSMRPMKYIMNVLLFLIISQFTTERILILVLCELAFPIIDSKLLTEVFWEIIISINRGIVNLYHRTRLESIIFSIVLSFCSYFNNTKWGILLICVLNILVMMRMITTKYFRKNNNRNEQVNEIIQEKQSNNITKIKCKDFLEMSDINPTDNKIKSQQDQQNTDILLQIKDMIIIVLKNNIFIKVLNPLASPDKDHFAKVFGHLFGLLAFGYISNFHLTHIIFLPIVTQNLIDVMFFTPEEQWIDGTDESHSK